MQILHMDNHLLAVDKPAGLPSQPDSSGDESLVDQARAWLKREFAKPGNVYVGLVHRLDRPTSGVVLLARTDKAASRLADQFRTRSVEKTYLALVEAPRPPEVSASFDQWLAPRGNGGMEVATEKTPGAKRAKLHFTMVATGGGRALLRVGIETGVKHQIRCQLAAAGMPVVGDFRYGSTGKRATPDPVQGGTAILLHARRLAFTHPVRKEPVAVTAPIPPYWNRWLAHFSNDAIMKIDAE